MDVFFFSFGSISSYFSPLYAEANVLAFKGLNSPPGSDPPYDKCSRFFRPETSKRYLIKQGRYCCVSLSPPCLVVLPLWLSWETWVSQCSKIFFKNCIILRQSRRDFFLFDISEEFSLINIFCLFFPDFGALWFLLKIVHNSTPSYF